MVHRGGRKRGGASNRSGSGHAAKSSMRQRAMLGNLSGLFEIGEGSHTGLGFSGASGGGGTNTISFVRGGSLEPHELLEPTVKDTTTQSGEERAVKQAQVFVKAQPDEPKDTAMEVKATIAMTESIEAKISTTTNVKAEKISVSVVARTSDVASDHSSSEEICFVPRNKRKGTPKATKPSSPPRSPIKPTAEPPRQITPPHENPTPILKDTRMEGGHEAQHDLDVIIQEYGGGKRTKKQARRDRARDRKSKKGPKTTGMSFANMGPNLANFIDEEDAIMQDYINNMSEDELEMLRGTFQKEHHDPEEQDSDMDGNTGRIEDLVEDDTDDSSNGVVEQIISKRSRPSGLQYLVRWKGLSVDDSSWVLYESLDSKAQELVEAFNEMRFDAEIEEARRGREAESDSKGVSSTDPWTSDKSKPRNEDEHMSEGYETYEDDDGLDTGAASFTGGRDVTKEGPNTITSTGDSEDDLAEDEELLRLMKRAEFQAFGLEDDSDSEDDDLLLLDDIFPNPNGEFPSASEMADYFEKHPDAAQPKRREKKGKKPNWNIDDPELLEKIGNAWDADRKKKSDRKKAREAMKGITQLPPSLSGKKYKPDMHLLYPKGMVYDDVKNEIREFLKSPMELLVFPPMEAGQRRVIHLLADDLKLKSKSVGKDIGKTPGRAPVLQKKPDGFVMSVQEADFIFRAKKYQIMVRRANFEGRFSTRGESGGGGGSFKGRMKGREVAFKSTNAHPNDGHVVGGDAPAIAAENRGRKLLEKMGYTEGAALGVQGNKGIRVPIPAIVKKGRGGLG
ncbi:hypothetical protein BJ508DRAFT_415761 [Ascobolus immersus RN42]|uniref:Protein SQS1 n=1 Tax=Ascobolus immersus RN42 TaxID=1160509 RepID=A0A3N4I6I5_ASCIM|nr:hypothetical protein BJ508DRAFT_415761 [Ascobolus immersus RN42]